MSQKNKSILNSKKDQNQLSLFDKKIEASTDDKAQASVAENKSVQQVFSDQEFTSEADVENELELSLEDFPIPNTNLGIFERLVNRVERLVVILYHKVFDEVEAAMYLRLPDPEHRGRETIRNYALRSKKLSYYKIGRNGLTFLKADLDLAIDRFKVHSFRDL
jgi:hypothetical protein